MKTFLIIVTALIPAMFFLGGLAIMHVRAEREKARVEFRAKLIYGDEWKDHVVTLYS